MADSDSVATAADKQSKRPAKRQRQTAAQQQSDAIEALFEKQPDIQLRELKKARTSKDLAPPPEIVTNVQGSSAGAGSGEFHVYKAARRREYERMRLMEEEARQEDEDKAWEEKQAESKAKAESKTDKNRKRRDKKKQNKSAGKAVANGVDKMDFSHAPKRTPMVVQRPEERADDGDADSPMTGAEEPEGNGVVIHDDD